MEAYLDRQMLCGNLDMLALALVAREPMHGYRIRWEIIHLSHGYLTPAFGGIYRVLRLMKRRGYIEKTHQESGHGRRRVTYGVTPKGRAELALRIRKWESFAAGIESVLFTGTTNRRKPR